jgi:hypothetical protein
VLPLARAAAVSTGWRVRAMPLDDTEAVGGQPEQALHEGRLVQGDLG